MAQLLSTWIDGFIGSAKATGNKVKNAFGKVIPEMKQYFTSDFMGKGWQIFKSGGTDENPEYTLEIDNIKIRKALIAHELIVDQIRAICGSLGISQACGKVKSVSENKLFYFLNMEGEETHGYGGFQVGDLVRCQRLTANGINGYWVQVTKIVTNDNGYNLVIPKDQFSANIYQQTSGSDADKVDTTQSTGIAMCTPSAGDNLVQYGNVSDKTRQSAIYIHADGTGRPAIDMLEGINSRSFVGKMVCRLGGELPEGGFGFYCENGKIISTDGTETNYRFSPDGTFELGKGAITYEKGVVTLSPDVVINWGATSQANVQYCISSSGSTQPTEGWSNTIPTLEQGKWLWTRTKYPDGTYTYSVSYCPKDGENGTSIKVKGTKSSIDELPTPPEDASDCYIIGVDLYVWDGTNWQNVGQFKGDQGDPGIGVKSVNTIYALGLYGNIEPEASNFKYDTMSSIVIADNANRYLWSADEVTYTNGSTALTGKYCVGKCSTLTNVVEQYGTSTSNTTQPTTWVDNDFPTGLAEGTWIWSRDKVVWKNNSVTYSDAQIKGYIAPKGKDGVGIVSVNTYYALFEYSTRTPQDNKFTYDTISSAVISDNSELYLWSGDLVTYTNGNTAITGKNCLGQCKTLASITEMYGTSSSSTTPPSEADWVEETFPTGLAEGTWVWSRNKITWKDGNTTYTEAKIVGYIAKKGDKGDKGDTGEDGQSLRPNLLDYTALTADTFNNPPSGVLINGIRTADVPDGCGGIFVNQEITTDYYDLFREDLLSKLSPNTKYTISFLLRKIDTSSTADANFAVILYTGTTGSEFINLSKSVIVNGEEKTLTSNVISLSHSGGAFTRYTITFTTASSLSSLSHAYSLWRMYKGSAGLILAQMKVERSGAASEWCLSEMDKFVALPTWVRQWDGTATQIGSTYIVSPNAFFGKKEDSDTSITGIYMSSDYISIDGETRTGLYAFDKGKVKVIIDPTKGVYKFEGEIEATSGRFYHSGSNGSLDMYVNADVPYIKAEYEEFSLKIQAAKDAFSFSENNTEYVKIGYFENFSAGEAGGIQLNSKDGYTYAELYSSVLRIVDNFNSCFTNMFGGHIDINNQYGGTCIQGAHIKLSGLKDGKDNRNYITLSPSDTYTEISFKGLKSATDATAMTKVSACDVILGEPTTQTWSGKKVKVRQLFWVEQVIS